MADQVHDRFEGPQGASSPVRGDVTEEPMLDFVVAMRAKGSGQRWHDDGVTAALSLRAIYLSERLPTLWSHFAAEYSADVQAAA
jgi:hypothetical protein